VGGVLGVIQARPGKDVPHQRFDAASLFASTSSETCNKRKRDEVDDDDGTRNTALKASQAPWFSASGDLERQHRAIVAAPSTINITKLISDEMFDDGNDYPTGMAFARGY
jgi:hypothetical protein